jgi:transposase-like protein
MKPGVEQLVPHGGKTGRVYCRLIADYTKATLYPVIEAAVANDAKIVTDEYPGYDRLKELTADAA